MQEKVGNIAVRGLAQNAHSRVCRWAMDVHQMTRHLYVYRWDAQDDAWDACAMRQVFVC